jgi:hypothetical protein
MFPIKIAICGYPLFSDKPIWMVTEAQSKIVSLLDLEPVTEDLATPGHAGRPLIQGSGKSRNSI